MPLSHGSIGWSLICDCSISLLYFKVFSTAKPGPEVIKLEFIHILKIKCNDWLLADILRFILSLILYSSFITSRPV